MDKNSQEEIKITLNAYRKTVVHLIATNFYGGPEKLVIGHLKSLNGVRYEGILVSFIEGDTPNETLEQARIAGLNHYGIPMSGRFDVKALWELNRLLLRGKVDLLCTHGYKSTVMGWWAGKKARIPVVAFSHGYTAENMKVAFYEWLERLILRTLDGIIFVSEGQKKRLESFGIVGKKSWIIHNATSIVDLRDRGMDKAGRKAVREELNIPDSATMVVSAGRLSPEKGHRFLLEAIRMLHEHKSNPHFVFCGNGPCQEELKKQSKELGIARLCHFVGFRRDIEKIYQAMDLMVLPSLTEGLPTVILEAFAFSKPVVATAVGGIPELVEDDINGILVYPERSDLLAEAIKKCLVSPEKRQRMGEAGYQKVRKEFTFESQKNKFEAVYDEMLKAER